MSKALEFIKSALQIAFSLVLLAIVLLNFQPLYLAARKFLERSASVSSIKLLGIEVSLNQASVDKALFQADHLTGADKSRILGLVRGLNASEFSRLMYVGQLKNLCEFENPSTSMRSDAAVDYTLRDKGLTKIENSPAILEAVRSELARLAAEGKTLENGYPLKCYDMTLTDDGYNVKTVLIDNLSDAFGERRPAP